MQNTRTINTYAHITIINCNSRLCTTSAVLLQICNSRYASTINEHQNQSRTHKENQK